MQSRSDEIAAHLDRILAQLARHAAVEGHAVERALHQVQVRLPVLDGGHDLLGAARQRHRRIVRVQGQADVGLLGHRDDRLEEAPGAFELLRPRVRADAVARRQVLRQRVVVGRVAGAGAAFLELVALGEAVRVEVVFDHRQPELAGDLDRLDDVGGLLLRLRPAPDHVVEAADHHVDDLDAARLEAIQAGLELVFLPRRRRPAHQDVRDADLLQAPDLRLVGGGRRAEADARPAGAVAGHAAERDRIGRTFGGAAAAPRAGTSPSSAAAPIVFSRVRRSNGQVCASPSHRILRDDVRSGYTSWRRAHATLPGRGAQPPTRCCGRRPARSPAGAASMAIGCLGIVALCGAHRLRRATATCRRRRRSGDPTVTADLRRPGRRASAASG